MLKGEIDVHMEIWTDNILTYMEDIKENKLKNWELTLMITIKVSMYQDML